MIDIVSLYEELAGLGKAEQQHRLGLLNSTYPQQVKQLANMLAIDDTPLSSNELLTQQLSQTPLVQQVDFIGQQVMGFTITKLVSSKGGMGLVFLGEQQLASPTSEPQQAFGNIHKAAIKILRTNKLNSQQKKGLFYNEASHLISLDHPNICSIYGVSEVLGQSCIVMDYIDGNSLDDWLSHQTISQPQKLNIFVQLLKAVSYLHSKNIFHGDLKPQNIIINELEQVVLIDLGLARRYQSQNSENRNKPVVNSPPDEIKAYTRFWSAPEQVAGHAHTAQSDVYSLGVILHYLFTGSHIVHSSPSLIYDAEVKAIMTRATSSAIDRRYENADEFLQVIESYVQGLPVKDFSSSPYYYLKKLLKRKPFTSIACALMVYSVATSLWIVLN